jgi:hypothetical protein
MEMSMTSLNGLALILVGDLQSPESVAEMAPQHLMANTAEMVDQPPFFLDTYLVHSLSNLR